MSDDIVIDSDDDIIIVDDDAPPKQSAPLCAESTSAHSSAEPPSMPVAGHRKGAPCDAKLRKLLGV